MYENEDELYCDPVLFNRKPSTRPSRAIGGRLALSRKLRESREDSKLTVNDQNNLTYLPNKREDSSKSCSQILPSNCGKIDNSLFPSTSIKTTKSIISCAQKKIGKEERKSYTRNKDAKNCQPLYMHDKKGNISTSDLSGFKFLGVDHTKAISSNSTHEPDSPNFRRHCISAESSLALASNVSEQVKCHRQTDDGTPKRKLISHKAIVENEIDSSPLNNMTQKGKMLARKTICGKTTPSDPGNVNAKRICLQPAFEEPVISRLSPSASKLGDQILTSNQNKNQCRSPSQFDSESFDQIETSHECQLNISDDMFLSLELNEDICDIRNTSGAKLCDKHSMEVLPPCVVNTKTLKEAARHGDGDMLDEKLALKEFGVEKSATFSSCAKSKPQVQQPITTFFTGAANTTLQTSVGAKKNDNKNAWAGMMAIMRSSAGAKKPEKSSAASGKMVAQTTRAKPGGGNNASTAIGSGSRWKSNGDRPCPFYKKIPGTSFAVDAFNYGTVPGVTSYFLSHFHSDHYIGLKASFSLPIYCTSITASLVQLNIRVKSQFLNILPMNQPHEIEGVRVTALDANHCPGSAMLLFQLRSGTNVLHVGDFRATPSMEHLHELSGLRISQLYLDTTYCDAKYDFPTQEDAVAKAVGLVLAHLHKHPRTVVVCGTYLIGKEKLFMGVAETLDCRIWALPPKAKILRLLQDPALAVRLVDDPLAATVHVVSMRQLNLESLQRYLAQYSQKFSHVLALKPSGWEYSRGGAPFTRGNVSIVGVPYSEHSSFSELARFVKFIRPSSIIPTVNVGSAQSRQAMQKHFASWLPSLH